MSQNPENEDVAMPPKKPAKQPSRKTSPATTLPEQSGDDEIISMEAAISLLKTTRPTFYRWLRAGKFRGMKTGRQWRFYRKDIEAFLRGEGPRIAPTAPTAPLLKAIREKHESLAGPMKEPVTGTDLEQTAYYTLGVAVRMGASDIHVHGKTGSDAVIRVRVDGVLHEVARFDRRILASFVEQWKVLTGVELSAKAPAADGHISLSYAGEPVDVRSSFVHTALGESVTMRTVRMKSCCFDLKALDLSSEAKARLIESLGSPTGIVVITGPMGCGKTTTLYSAVTHVASPSIKVMTVEDPVEVLLEETVQIPVRHEAGMTFPAALARIFRSDPDVVMVGDVRGRETLDICFRAAAAGHLVLMALSAPAAVDALRHMSGMLQDPGSNVLGDVVRLVLAQRLLRKVCPDCAAPYTPPAEHLEKARAWAAQGGLDLSSVPNAFRKACGCQACGQTGYRGRLAIAEALTVTPAILHALRSGAEPKQIAAIAVEQGTCLLAAEGIRCAASGTTTLDEVFRVLR